MMERRFYEFGPFRLDANCGPTDEPGPPIDAFLSLECNLCLDTCTISQVLAGLAPEHSEVSVADLRRLFDSAGSLEQWLNIHEYW